MKNISLRHIQEILPKRTKRSNKTDAGKVLIVGGGTGLYGAGIMSALASTRSGAGYTHLMSDLATFPWVKFPDFILHPLKLSELKGKETFAVAIGPGLGLQDSKKKYIEYLIKKKFESVVIDADGLTLLSTMQIKNLPKEWILTPHEGELARLLKVSSQKVKANREASLKLAQEKYGCHVLLKGSETLIIDDHKNIYKVSEGTPALAKAGTGDVLLGMIAALRAQKLSSKDAMIAAVFIHGWCSKEWERTGHNRLSLRPTDIVDLLSKFPNRGTKRLS